MTRFFLLTLSLNLIVACNTDVQAKSPTEDWQLGGAWGKGLSRYELNLDEDTRMRPDTFRVTLAKTNIAKWELSSNWEITLEADLSLHHWNDPWNDADLSVISAVPMWRIQYSNHLKPFVRLGIGLALLDDTHWMDRKMGSHLMFEDKLEVGAQHYSHHLAIGISHFSNANLASINHGANVHYVSYAYRF